MNEKQDERLAQDVPYSYRISIGRSFEDVLDARDSADDTMQTQPRSTAADLGVDGLAEALRRWGCVLLQARGGAGKTYTAERVRETLESDGIWTVLVPAVTLVDVEDLGAWSPSQWASADPESSTRRGQERVQSARQNIRGVIMVDGLNEVDRSTAQTILDAIGPATASDPQVSFLVTDRLIRRAGTSPHWRYATLGAVPTRIVEAMAGPHPAHALRIPYYLRRHIQGKRPDEILAESISRFVGDDAETFEKLAEVAYKAYGTLNRRTVTGAAVLDAVGEQTLNNMIAAQCLIEETRANRSETVDRQSSLQVRTDADKEYRFEHHLLHDYLASRHLARCRNLWNNEGFDTLTLKASSFDALALALAELHNGDDAEQLVQSVYNWNYYAAAYMIEDDRLFAGVAGEALALALLAALAEKRFDAIVPTVERVEDALRVSQLPLAQLLIDAPDRDAVVAIISRHLPVDYPEWFSQWANQFTRPSGTSPLPEDLDAAASEQPVLGWGAANCLRRLDLTNPTIAQSVRNLLLNENETVRWRAAHALGPHADPASLSALQAVFADTKSESWVAYGVLRAQFEQAREWPEQGRRLVIQGILGNVQDRLAEAPYLRAEAARCLDVSPLPSNWHRDVASVLDFLWQLAEGNESMQLVALARRLRQRKEDQEDAA